MKRLSWLSILVLPLSLACTSEDAPTNQRPANVILISIDTLRADHLASYGYEKATSPHLDRLRADAVQFEQAIAQAPSTLHSHASILSSLLPHHHRASWAAKTRLPEEVTSLPEILHSAGYQTAAFTGGGQMDRVFGLDQGFDVYRQPGSERFQGTVRSALEWLQEAKQAPFFLFLHSYEPHHPYAPAPEYARLFEHDYSGPLPAAISVDLLRQINRDEVEIDADDLEHIIATYDAEIRSMDDGLGHLVEWLRQMELYDDTMIVFTSDHGEEFGEHGRIGWHSHSLYDELLRVPLVVKLPGAAHAGASVSDVVRSLDIAPTILATIGLPAPEDFAGTSLFPLIEGTPAPGLVAVSRMDRSSRRDISSVRTASWKLYRNQLFNLDLDAEEQWDAAVNHPDVVADLERQLVEAVNSRRSF
ncbi:MAG: sulfatase, partial [Acidobacteriota bacterium]|nr:sulfatase [Acidobacteriota bacterium]